MAIVYIRLHFLCCSLLVGLVLNHFSPSISVKWLINGHFIGPETTIELTTDHHQLMSTGRVATYQLVRHHVMNWFVNEINLATNLVMLVTIFLCHIFLIIYGHDHVHGSLMMTTTIITIMGQANIYTHTNTFTICQFIEKSLPSNNMSSKTTSIEWWYTTMFILFWLSSLIHSNTRNRSSAFNSIPFPFNRLYIHNG